MSRFQVIETDVKGIARCVYSTDDREHASCFAESHFVRTPHKVVAIDSYKRKPLTDRDGREYVWERKELSHA